MNEPRESWDEIQKDLYEFRPDWFAGAPSPASTWTRRAGAALIDRIVNREGFELVQWLPENPEDLWGNLSLTERARLSLMPAQDTLNRLSISIRRRMTSLGHVSAKV